MNFFMFPAYEKVADYINVFCIVYEIVHENKFPWHVILKIFVFGCKH